MINLIFMIVGYSSCGLMIGIAIYGFIYEFKRNKWLKSDEYKRRCLLPYGEIT